MSGTQARHLRGAVGPVLHRELRQASVSPSVQGGGWRVSQAHLPTARLTGLAAVFSSNSEILVPRKPKPGRLQPNLILHSPQLCAPRTLPGSSAPTILTLLLRPARRPPVPSHKTIPCPHWRPRVHTGGSAPGGGQLGLVTIGDPGSRGRRLTVHRPPRAHSQLWWALKSRQSTSVGPGGGGALGADVPGAYGGGQ